MDIFCQIKKKLKDQIISQTKNFYLMHDGYPLLEGHLLLIPKKHVDCYLNLDKKLISELKFLKKHGIDFLKENYCQPVLFEHGITGQTVMHAHLHLLPTDKLILKELKKYAVEKDRHTIPYLYFEYLNINKYFIPKTKINPGLMHSNLYARILKRPSNGLMRAKALSRWLLSVKKKYSLWQKKD